MKNDRDVQSTIDFKIEAGRRSQERKYWLENLSGEWVKTCLPAIPFEKKPGELSPVTLKETLSAKLSAGLVQLGTGSDVRLHIVMTSVVALLLSRYTGGDDIFIGSPIARAEPPQEHEELLNTVLILRVRPSSGMTFKDLLMHMRQTIIEADKNRNYPMEFLAQELHLPVKPGESPFFDVAVMVENIHDRAYLQSSQPAVIFSFSRSPGGIDAETIYLPYKYSRSFMEQVSRHLRNLAEAIIDNPGLGLGEYEYLSPEERQRLLVEFNDTLRPYPAHKTIAQLFDEQAGCTPDRPALIETPSGAVLTYRHLQIEADSLAQKLQEMGAGPNCIIGIKGDRSLDTVIGILGILKSGGAYLPLDPDWPQERIDYIISDSGAEIVIGQTSPPGPLSKRGEGNPTDLAYVIYTSGTTGKPKGTLVDQRNVVRLVKNTNYVEFNEKDRLLQTGALAFDASTFEIWGALLNGLTLCLADLDTLLQADTLKRAIRQYDITMMWLTSPLFNQVVNADIEVFAGLKSMLVGGDVLSAPHILQVLRRFPRLAIINGYGPTENTTFSTTHKIDREYDRGIPIGKPIAQSLAYILDQNRRPVPIGVPGELWVGGHGLSRGYLNNPELTAERFVDEEIPMGAGLSQQSPLTPHHSPITTHHSPITNRLYRTGDLARWLDDGNIEFLGRLDFQVKIRGFRIEPGEIENRLLSHPTVREAVVMTHEEKTGEKYLCAYLAGSPGQPIDTQVIRDFLAQKLPDYMIPAHFVCLEKMPLNANGKIDRRLLPEPEVSTGKQSALPRDEMEKKLLAIWVNLLGLTSDQAIGIDDHFFDLGGHSLKAMTLAAEIHQKFNVKVPLTEIFKNTSIRALANRIRQATGSRFEDIEAVEKCDYYGLSSAQKRLYFLQHMDLKSTTYNMPYILPLGKEIDRQRLKQAVKELIARHESLRTSFEMLDERPVQRIHGQVAFELEVFELEGQKGHKRHKGQELVDQIIQEFIRPFDLAKAPLIRSALIETADGDHIWVVDVHHIVSDGTSHIILGEDFQALYQGRELPPLNLHYKDFSNWQNRFLTSGHLEKQQQYWLTKLSGEIPRLDLAGDFPRPHLFTFAGDTCPFSLEGEEALKFKDLGKNLGATLYMNMLAALNVLLFKYTGQTDILVGTGIAGRPHADVQRIVGMFVNTLVMRNNPTGDKTFRDFLEEVSTVCLAAFENQDVQFEALVERLNVERDASRNPLFDISLVVQNFRQPGIGQQQKENTLPPALYRHPTSKFDITFFAEDRKTGIHLDIEYYSAVFKRQTILALAAHLGRVIKTVSSNPQVRLKDIELIDEPERREILDVFNATNHDFPQDKTIIGLFEDQVEKNPACLALIAPGPSGEPGFLTYRELDQAANRLAHYLAGGCGLKPDTCVGILMDNSLDLGIAVLGVLKAGCAYLPLDTGSPRERIKSIIDDVEVAVVLSQNRYVDLLDRWQWECPSFHTYLCLDSTDIPEKECLKPLDPAPSPGHLAYIIYTSGSTGKPKGVAVEHRGVVNMLLARQSAYRLGPDSTALQLFSYSFDGFVTSFFSPLIAGARLVMLLKEDTADSQKIGPALVNHRVSHLICVPGLFGVLLETLSAEELSSLQQVTLAGERTSVEILKQAREKNPNLEIINEYGVTEASVMSTLYRHQEQDETIKIGTPIWNTQVLVLDRYGFMQPTGVMGELALAGVGLSRGYLNNPDLTAEKFTGADIQIGAGLTPRSGTAPLQSPLTNHQSPLTNHHSPLTTRLYRTGDLGRWLDDGTIEYRGRIDHQVKIRGFRIELGEIENQLLQQPGVKEAAVLARGQDNDRYLCAYACPGTLNPEELHQHLAGRLPDYMVPRHILVLDRLPRTPSGKIATRALPAPDIMAGNKFQPPRDQLEQQLVDIWAEVLGISPATLGIDDDFFHLGGHSLKATILSSRIQKRTDVRLPLAEIFRHPTIRGQAEYLRTASKEAYSAIEPAEKKEYYPLSATQMRFYILQQMNPETTAYNMSNAHLMTGAIDRDRFAWAVDRMIDRHETLRTAFVTINGLPVQRIHEQVAFELEVLELKGPKGRKGHKGEELIETIVREFTRPFDLTCAPLLRLELIGLEKDRFLLLFDMHHIISDGTSMTLFIKEFTRLYAGHELPELALQYRDFADWQHRQSTLGQFDTQKRYWQQKFADGVPVLNLTTDFPRPAVQSFEGDNLEFRVEKPLFRHIKEALKQTGTTLYMFLLAVFNVLLARYSGQEDIVTGTTIAGRHHPDLQQVIGLLIETLVQRNFPDSSLRFSEFLKNVCQETLAAHENQAYPFRQLIHDLSADNELARNPVFDVMLMVQNFDFSGQNWEGIDIKPYKPKTENQAQTAKVDITLEALEHEAEESLHFTLEYCTRLFERRTMERLAGHFVHILGEVVENLHIRIQDIEVMDDREKMLVLETFNQPERRYAGRVFSSVTEMFEKQVDQTPDRVALVGKSTDKPGNDEVSLTYRELDRQTDALALELRQKGVDRGMIVALQLGPGLEMIIGMWAILKAGGAYLPIDPDAPQERIGYMLADSGAEIVIGQTSPPGPLSKRGEGENGVSPAQRFPAPTDPAYVIYTSGTTGRPKGVLVDHGNLAGYMAALAAEIELQASDISVQLAAYVFDTFGEELYPIHLSGGKLTIPDPQTFKDIPALCRYIARHQVTYYSGSPLLINELNREAGPARGANQNLLASLRLILVGGDRLKAGHIDKLRGQGELFNTYGPTESTICAAYYRCPGEESGLPANVPIGKPLLNYHIFILDRHSKPLPLGVPGELCVGGIGVTCGYLNRPELTAERFVDEEIPMGAVLSQQSPSLPAKTVLSFACGFTNCGLSAIRFSMRSLCKFKAEDRIGTRPKGAFICFPGISAALRSAACGPITISAPVSASIKRLRASGALGLRGT